MGKSEITVLNFMAGLDFTESLDRQLAWGIRHLDLKDHIYGKALLDLSDREAEEAAHNIESRGMETYCFSTALFFEDIEMGEDVFRKNHLEKLDRILELARIIKPKVVRLLAAKTRKRLEIINTLPYIQKNYPWLIPMYREAIEKIFASGFTATIENEANGCIWAKPEEITGFFRELNCGEKVFLTFDIQNLWQMGTYPSVEVYEMLEDITEYFHLKGSQSQIDGGKTIFACSLEDSSWQVSEITRKAVTGKRKAVVCLNPLKGEKIAGYSYEGITKRDLDYLRNQIGELR